MKIKFGALVVDGRGKIGGHVASKNRSGAYLRTKVTPSNPSTVAQLVARSLIASFSAGWSGLTEAQRLAWNGAVESWQSTDIFGDIKKPTGLNLYVKLNSNLANISLPAIAVPPEKVTLPSTLLAAATLSVATQALTLHLADELADEQYVLVRATPPVSQGVNFVKSELRVIGSNQVSVDDVFMTTAYTDKYGALSLGDKVFVTIQYVALNGQKSIEQKVQMTIVA